MERRRFIATVAGAALGTPGAARAQGAKVYRIGFLWDSPAVWPHALEAFRHGLRELGWIEGRNIVIEYRWLEGRFERLPSLAEELVRIKADVIVAPTSIYTGAAKRATSTIPIVFISHADPLGSGHVTSLARPGGNATGLTIIMSETMAKSVELLKGAIPALARLAVMWDPATPSHRPGLKAVEDAGRALGLRVHAVAVRNATEYEAAFTAMVQERAGAVIVLSTARTPPSCRCSKRRSSSWSSTSGRRRRSDSRFRRRCSRGRIKSSSKDGRTGRAPIRARAAPPRSAPAQPGWPAARRPPAP